MTSINHLDTALETVGGSHQPVNSEAGKMCIADTRKLSGLHAAQSFGLMARELAVIQHADNRAEHEQEEKSETYSM